MDGRQNTCQLGRGGLAVLNVVLSPMPTYYMSIFIVPYWVSDKIDRIRRKFLWQVVDKPGNKYHLVSWAKCVDPNERGIGNHKP